MMIISPQYVVGILLLASILLLPLTASAKLDNTETQYQWDGKYFSVPLELKDNSGVDRHAWPVTTGIPFPAGIIQDTQNLRLTDREGNEISGQFTVLNRHWARDNSIKWLLVDFQIDLKANGQYMIYLRNDKGAAPISNPVRIQEDKTSFSVSTGPLQAVISRSTGRLLESVTVNGLQVLKAAPDDGPFIRSGEIHQAEHFQGSSWNTHGWDKSRVMETVDIREGLYKANAFDATEVMLEEQGPLRTVIRIRGRHMPAQKGDGVIAKGLYNFTARLHFYKDKSYIKVEYDIENSDREYPLWNHMFREAGLTHSLNLDSNIIITAGGQDKLQDSPTDTTFTLPPGGNAILYQPENKSIKPNKYQPPVFESRYYVAAGQAVLPDRALARGKKGRYLDVYDGVKGVSIAMRYLWQEAPRAIKFADNRLDVLVQADTPDHKDHSDFKRPYYDLDFAERNLHDTLYYFHTEDPAKARIKEVAGAFEYPLFARAPTAWYSDSDAWYFEISPEPGTVSRKLQNLVHWYPNEVGIKRHAYFHSYNSGGHHASLSSGWLSFLRSGNLVDLERNLTISRWNIAHNPGWNYLNNKLDPGSSGNQYTSLDNQLKDWDRLTAYGPKDFYLWRSDDTHTVETKEGSVQRNFKGTTYLNEYKWLPDHEHYALFRLFEYYNLTGDRRSLDAINGFVNWNLNFQHKHLFNRKLTPLTDTDLFLRDPEALRRGHYSRVYAWMLYTNLAGFQTTGDPVMDIFARWQIRRLLALLRHRHGQLTSWDVNPSPLTTFLPDQLRTKLAGHIDSSLVRSSDDNYESTAKTWMEAKGVLALHEAYKTYDDERILDAIWGLADYFSHHVVFYPRLGMINQFTSMPNEYLGKTDKSLSPTRHDRATQIWPVLYYYTGWPEIKERYDSFEAARDHAQDEFIQTIYWQRMSVPKKSAIAPQAITDLNAIKSDKSGITLTWTSPTDDGPSGKAARYFVKISDKPIVEFAPTDNPARAKEMERVVNAAEVQIIASRNKKEKRYYNVKPGTIEPEPDTIPRMNPGWSKINAFWMAEHVAGEPGPSAAGTKEIFTFHEIKPHNWFGTPSQPTLDILPSGSYYIAICSWDEDQNLSRLSNVVSLTIK